MAILDEYDYGMVRLILFASLSNIIHWSIDNGSKHFIVYHHLLSWTKFISIFKKCFQNSNDIYYYCVYLSMTT